MNVGDFVVRKTEHSWIHGAGAHRIISKNGNWVSLQHAEGNGPRLWNAARFCLATLEKIEREPLKVGDIVHQKSGLGSTIPIKTAWLKNTYESWRHASPEEYREAKSYDDAMQKAVAREVKPNPLFVAKSKKNDIFYEKAGAPIKLGGSLKVSGKLRPKEVTVLFPQEVLARFDWSEETTAKQILEDIAKQTGAAMGIPKHLMESEMKHEPHDAITALQHQRKELYDKALLAEKDIANNAERLGAQAKRLAEQGTSIAKLNEAAERAMVAIDAAPPQPPIMRERVTGCGRLVRVGNDMPAGSKQLYAGLDTNGERGEFQRYPATLEPIPKGDPTTAFILLIFAAIVAATFILNI